MKYFPEHPVMQATEAVVIVDHINKDASPYLCVTIVDGKYPFPTSWKVLKRLADEISAALPQHVDNGSS